MTRKDFELIARALADSRPGRYDDKQYHTQHQLDCEGIADALRSTNPRFDRERFLAACGVNQPA